MHANNFKILQVLINNKCKESICQIKAEFLREHYTSNYWAKSENEHDDFYEASLCCKQRSDAVYSNQVFYTKLESAHNYDEYQEKMNLPNIYDTFDATIDNVFYDCSAYGSGSSSGSNSSRNTTPTNKETTKKEIINHDVTEFTMSD